MRGGLKLVMADAKRETRGAGRAQQGCTLHLSVQLLHSIMYNFLTRRVIACGALHMKGQVSSMGD